MSIFSKSVFRTDPHPTPLHCRRTATKPRLDNKALPECRIMTTLLVAVSRLGCFMAADHAVFTAAGLLTIIVDFVGSLMLDSSIIFSHGVCAPKMVGATRSGQSIYWDCGHVPFVRFLKPLLIFILCQLPLLLLILLYLAFSIGNQPISVQFSSRDFDHNVPFN